MSMNRPPADEDRLGMRLMFWTWMTLIVVGLAVMIVTPLTGA